MRLREMKVIDDRALLEDLEYPHREEVLERVKAWKAELAEQEAEAESSAGDRTTRFPHQAGASPRGRF